MNLGLFRKNRKSKDTSGALLPAGTRIYCVGDIHGRADLLAQLHDLILEDAGTFPGSKTVVYLGDYVDRGSGSREVIEMLVSEPLQGFEAIYLMGNHELALLNFLERPLEASAWLHFGGREALASYGIPLTHIPLQGEIPGLAERFAEALPAHHHEFITSTLTQWRCGGYYFVHAGIRPGTALDKQSPADQLMIRDEFLNSDKDHGAIIVHGHTITPVPELLPNRIGIDTGAYDTGVLTCVVLEGNEQRILQTCPAAVIQE